MDTFENKDGLVFNGTNSYAKINMKQEISYPITVEMMVSSIDSDRNEVLFIMPSNNIAIGIWNNYLCISSKYKTNRFEIPTDFFNRTSKHIVCVYTSQTEYEMYINGKN